MLAPPDPPKKVKARQRRTAHQGRSRRRKKLGLVNLPGDMDQIAVETLLEEHGLLPRCVDHSYDELKRAWQRYLNIILKPQS